MPQLFNLPRLAVAFLVLIAIFVPLERLFPLTRRAFWRKGALTDTFHFFISGGERVPKTGPGGMLVRSVG